MENELQQVEQNANWHPAETDEEEKTKETIREREKQSFASRLSEYITGLKPEDPAMLERLTNDQDIIRAKYNLPSWHLSPSEFEHALQKMAKDLGVKIRPKSECGTFFKENPMAEAVHFADGRIGANINRSELNKYKNSLRILEHELVHEIQNQRSPSMPVEAMEYEAYVASANLEFLKDHPKAVNDILFNFFIGSSVNIYYQLESKRRGEKVIPEWDNPKYFLHRDGVTIPETKEQGITSAG
jgi:hypothetical protein